MIWPSIKSSPLIWLLLYCSIIVTVFAASGPSFFCSRNIYNRPTLQDCSDALAALPLADQAYRFYFEQQLRAAPPESDWQGYQDARPIALRRNIVQIPKIWSKGEETRPEVGSITLHPRTGDRDAEDDC